MTAPAVTARSAPVGPRMDDGHKTLIAFAADPDVSLWEKTVTPPGLDGGDAIETTTMHNNVLRTMAARQLKTLTDMTTMVAYLPAAFTQLLALINIETSITLHWPNNSSLSFYGYLRTFEPGDISEGEQPEATVTITPTNVDPVTRGEELPVYTPPP